MFFDKEAVKIGGGEKHRMTLNEMIMIKDNHLDEEIKDLQRQIKEKRNEKKQNTETLVKIMRFKYI